MFYIVESTAANRYFCRYELKRAIQENIGDLFFRVWLNQEDLALAKLAEVRCIPVSSCVFID